MKYPVLALMIGVACFSGCISQTVTRESGVGQAGGKVQRSRIIWIWQKDFWGR